MTPEEAAARGPPELEISGSFTNFKVERKDDELQDEKFPVTLHAAAQLFVMAGMPDNAKRLVKDVDAFIEIFKAGPDGVIKHLIGRGVVCWGCGHVGIPRNTKECPDKGYSEISPICAACGEDFQTNFIDPQQPDGTKIPWIQVEEEENPERAQAAQAAAGRAPASKKVKPNEPCPCASGKKWKKCCGAA